MNTNDNIRKAAIQYAVKNIETAHLGDYDLQSLRESSASDFESGANWALSNLPSPDLSGVIAEIDSKGTLLSKKEVISILKSYQPSEQGKWIEINDEEDFPEETGNFWITTEIGHSFIAFNKPHLRIFVDASDDSEIEYKYVTHYQPIIKPEPPKTTQP